MKKEHEVTLNNTTKEMKVVGIPDSYGYAVLKPGNSTVKIPYDDKWGLTGEEKVEKLVEYHKDIKEVKDKFTGKVLTDTDEELLSETIVEDGEWNQKPSKEGYTVEGLYREKTFENKVETPIKNVQGDITLYAKLNRIVLTCKVMENDSQLVSNQVNYGESWNPSVSKEGHDLAGLYKEKGFTTKVETPVQNVKENMTLYAKFNIKQFTCKVIDGESAIVTDTINWDASWNPTVNKEGFTLEGLYQEKEFSNKVNPPINNVRENKTLYAKFTENPVEASTMSARTVTYKKEELEALDDKKLKDIAKEVGVDGYNRYTRRDSLISAILSKM